MIRVVAIFSDRSSNEKIANNKEGNVRGGRWSDPRAQRWMLFEVKWLCFHDRFFAGVQSPAQRRLP